jgi:hypothetical protein
VGLVRPHEIANRFGLLEVLDDGGEVPVAEATGEGGHAEGPVDRFGADEGGQLDPLAILERMRETPVAQASRSQRSAPSPRAKKAISASSFGCSSRIFGPPPGG